MDGLKQWLRNLGTGIAGGLRRFMAGRYGNDKLNLVILCGALVMSIVSAFLLPGLLKLITWAASYGLLIWSLCRSLSRNTYKRYEENRRFLMHIERIKDREHKHFDCPRCRQPVRVPRGKGKIAITCPKCGERFIRKS